MITHRDTALKNIQKGTPKVGQWSSELLHDKELILSALAVDGFSLAHASEELRSDRDVVMTAIQCNALAIQHASKTLLDDEELVTFALSQNKDVFRWLSERLRNKPEIAWPCIKEDIFSFWYVGEKLRDDAEFAAYAVKRCGLLLEYVSPRLKNDKEFVAMAIRYDSALRKSREPKTVSVIGSPVVICEEYRFVRCGALQYANPVLRDDYDIVLTAVSRNGNAIRHASKRLQNDASLARIAISKDYLSFQYIGEELKNSESFIISALNPDVRFLKFIPDELKSSRTLFLAAVKYDGYALTYASPLLKNDRSLFLEAIRHTDVPASLLVGSPFKKDYEIVRAALEQSGTTLSYCDTEIQACKELVAVAVMQNPYALNYASEQLRNEPDLVALQTEVKAVKSVGLHQSVTTRASCFPQPRGGLLPPRLFETVIFDDVGEVLCPHENINPGLVGLAVDYLTRFLLGSPGEDAFHISLVGAKIIGESDTATLLLNAIDGLNSQSIVNAVKLVGYDVIARSGKERFVPVEAIVPDNPTVENIRIMLKRSLHFFEEYGPILCSGFSFPESYTELVTCGDGDYITSDTLWDFKVSVSRPNKSQTLQILMYWIMGIHASNALFKDIKFLGIFNPRLNTISRIPIESITKDILRTVEHDVLGYNTSML